MDWSVIFDGIGTEIISVIIGLIIGGVGGGLIGYRIGIKNKVKQKQKAGKNSTQTQIGSINNVNLSEEKKDDK